MPFLKLVLPYILGILLCQYLAFKPNEKLLLALILLFIAAAILIQTIGRRYPSNGATFFSIIILCACICLGSLRFVQADSITSSSLHFGQDKTLLLVEIAEELKESNRYKRYFALALDPKRSDSSSMWFKLLVNIQKSDSLDAIFLPGDQLLLRAEINRVAEATNPAQFDYSKYLAMKGVYHQLYADEWNLIDSSKGVKRYATKIRRSLISRFENSHISRSSLVILKAILLGDKAELSKGVKSSFANAGAMHILAVSGLHLGIVYLLFSQLFQLLPMKKVRHIKSILIILILWSFALVTGLSASVQRSALMFSLIVLSEVFSRKNNSLNSVAASAFILLLIDPRSLFDPAFQLSYSAVVGIILLYPPLFNLLQTKSKWVNKIIALMIVSIAAQLATLPFSILYFHQFPTYFLLTNLLVIPLSFLIVANGLISSILLLTTNQAFYMDIVLDRLIQLLDYFVSSVAGLPYSIIAPLWINNCSAIFLSLFILMISIYLMKKRSKYIIYAMVALLFILLIESTIHYKRSVEEQLTVYSFAKLHCISYRKGRRAIVFQLDSLSGYEEEIVLDHLNSKHVDPESINFEQLHLSGDMEAASTLNIGEKTILICHKVRQEDPFSADIIISRSIRRDPLLENPFPSATLLFYSYLDKDQPPNSINLRQGAYILDIQ